MDVVTGIGASLVAGLLGFLFGWLWQRLRIAAGSRRARRFWKPFVRGDLQVVIGRFLEFGGFEPSGFVGVGDAIGMTELRAFLEGLGLRGFSVSYADVLVGDSLKTNLILLGGPDANAVTMEAAARIKSTIRFGDPSVHEISIYDSEGDRVFAPSKGAGSNDIGTDYGVILKTTNPFARDKQLLIIAGSYGYGTWAGVRFTMSKRFLEDRLVASGQPVEGLIEADIALGAPQDIRLVVLRQLEGHQSPYSSV